MATTIISKSAVFYDNNACIQPLSKDLKVSWAQRGDLETVCELRGSCQTLRTTGELRIELKSHETGPCDAREAVRLDGALAVTQFVTAFDRESGRGFHLGDFVWSSGTLRIEGRISGITHAGLVRTGSDCDEPCRLPGVLYGRLSGQVLRGPRAVLGNLIEANYRIALDNLELSSKRAKGTGSLEGVVIVPCRRVATVVRPVPAAKAAARRRTA